MPPGRCRYEGLFGFALMAGLLLPILQWLPGTEGNGLHEDTIETLHMLAGSRPLQVGVESGLMCSAPAWAYL